MNIIFEIFTREKFKYVSVMRDGFAGCHEFMKILNFTNLRHSDKNDMPSFVESVDIHEPSNCFHCVTKDSHRSELGQVDDFVMLEAKRSGVSENVERYL